VLGIDQATLYRKRKKMGLQGKTDPEGSSPGPDASSA
jgi:hypothetical protein